MTDFEAVYLQTSYIVDDGSVRFTIRLDASNESLHEFLATQNASTWAFLTAYNPLGQELPQSDNERRQNELIGILDQQKYAFLRGYGKGDDETWPPEPSLFILDVSRPSAIDFAKRFNQNAILWGKLDFEPELIWCA